MPASDFASQDPALSPQQVAQHGRILDGMRRINARVVRLPGSLGSLASLDSVTQTRALQPFRLAFDRDHPNDVRPFNPATGGGGPA